MDIGGGNFVPLRVREERLPASRRIKRGFLLLAVMLWAFRRGWCCQGRHFCYFFEFWWMKPLQKRPIILKIQVYSPGLSFGSFWPKIQSALLSILIFNVDRRDERNNNGKTTALDMDDGGGRDELSLLAIRLSSQKSVAPLMHSLLSQNE